MSFVSPAGGSRETVPWLSGWQSALFCCFNNSRLLLRAGGGQKYREKYYLWLKKYFYYLQIWSDSGVGVSEQDKRGRKWRVSDINHSQSRGSSELISPTLALNDLQIFKVFHWSQFLRWRYGFTRADLAREDHQVASVNRSTTNRLEIVMVAADHLQLSALQLTLSWN